MMMSEKIVNCILFLRERAPRYWPKSGQCEARAVPKPDLGKSELSWIVPVIDCCRTFHN